MDEEISQADVFSSNGYSRRREITSPSSIASRSSTTTIGSRTGTPSMDQTLSAAFRDKIRNRLQTAKRKVQKLSIGEEIREREEHQLNKEVEVRIKTSNECKKNIAKLLEVDESNLHSKVSNEEAYKFFTQTEWDDDDEEMQKTLQTESKTLESENEVIQIEKEEKEDSRLYIKDMFDNSEKWSLVERCQTKFRPKEEQIKRDKIISFMSSDIGSGETDNQSQNLVKEEDGLYVDKSTFSNRNINKIRRRALLEKAPEENSDDPRSSLEVIRFPEQTNFSAVFSFNDDNTLTTLQPACSLKQTFTVNGNFKHKLVVKITAIHFSAHPLFNEEILATRKLIEFYNVYNDITNENVVTIASRKLHALQLTINNLSQDSINQDDKEDHVKMYRNLLEQTYIKRNEKVLRLRNALLQVLSCWEELQKIRNLQSFVSTNVKLICVENATVDLDEEKQEWNKLVAEAFEIEKYLYKENDEKSLEEYRRDLRAWKQRQRTKRRTGKSSKEVLEDDDEPSRPEPPKSKFDEDEALGRIRNSILLPDGRLPGEPKFSDISLDFTNTVSGFKECPKNEQRRRNELAKQKYYLKCFVDGKQMFKTPEREPNSNVVVNFNYIGIANVTNSQSKVKLEVYEHYNINRSEMAQVYIPLPDALTTVNNALPIKVEFASKTQIDQQNLSGLLECCFYWDTDNNGMPQCPSDLSQSSRNEQFSKNLENLSLDQVQQWLQQLMVQDPNDPNNVLLIEAVKNYKEFLEQNESVQNCFRLDPLMKEFEFATEDEIESNLRLRMLKLRWEGAPNFRNFKFVPLDEKEVPIGLFEEKVKSETLLKGKKGFEEKREKAIQILTKVREQLMRQSQGSFDRPRTIEDLVIEDDIPSIGTLGFHLLTAAQSKRPLNPLRKERKKIAANLISNSNIRIVVTIMHAFNVPVRMKDEKETHRKTSIETFAGESAVESRVCPFVEVIFQRESARTTTAEGPKPTWNETLSLKLRPPGNDCSVSSLTKISECIYLNLFDEVTIDSQEDLTDEGEQIIRKRSERRWLGSLKVPFSTLYLNSTIEGTFGLNTPTILLGYEYDSKSWLLGHAGGHNSDESSKRTYLTLFVTIDPSLQLPEPVAIKCDSNESEEIVLHAKKWQQELNQQLPGRNIKALAVDLNAKFVLVTRYLKPLKPPEELLHNLSAEEVMQRLARFVSLIPTIPDSVALPGCDIWAKSDQFLEMLMGDEEEHAILLCNYFLFLGKRAGIILGAGIPEGPTSYVIVWEYTEQEPSVWNATTGQQFSVFDSYIPLNSIGCIITPDDVYANVSKHQHPNRLNYNIGKTSNWKRLFTKSFPNQRIMSIQPDSLDYTPIDQEFALYLQDKLEKHLKESLMRWRRRLRTFFNRHCIQMIKKILPRLEKRIGKFQQSDLIQELTDVLVVNKMTGFPLNMAFTDVNSITEAVYATGVHLVEDKKAEFALAVYVHPYPCNILSVWVYIAALTRHN